MTTAGTPPAGTGRRQRFDARRNQQALLDAAAAVFVRAGVDATAHAARASTVRS